MQLLKIDKRILLILQISNYTSEVLIFWKNSNNIHLFVMCSINIEDSIKS